VHTKVLVTPLHMEMDHEKIFSFSMIMDKEDDEEEENVPAEMGAMPNTKSTDTATDTPNNSTDTNIDNNGALEATKPLNSAIIT
jgi:hypothetical protein